MIEDYVPQILPILKWPNDNKLHEKSVDVVNFNDDLLRLTLDMLHTMFVNNGIGLAAPQTGNMINVIVVALPNESPIVLINPKIKSSSEEVFQFNEGCLSVPGYFENRKRPKEIVVEYQSIFGDATESAFDGLMAFVIQHEIDHLQGKVFVDNSSAMKKQRILEKMKKVASRK